MPLPQAQRVLTAVVYVAVFLLLAIYLNGLPSAFREYLHGFGRGCLSRQVIKSCWKDLLGPPAIFLGQLNQRAKPRLCETRIATNAVASLSGLVRRLAPYSPSNRGVCGAPDFN